MSFLAKFIAKIILNGAALYIALKYVAGFVVEGGFETIVVAAVVLTLLNTFLRPVLRLLSTPLLFVTFGLFSLVLNVLILWIADQFLAGMAFQSLTALVLTSLIVALANAFF